MTTTEIKNDKVISVRVKISTISNGNEAVSLDDALSLIPYGIFHILFLIASGGCLMAVIIETLGISFIIPIAKCDLNLDITERGILSTIGFLGVVSSSHLWGYVADTKGRKPVIVYTLIISSFFTFLSSFAQTFWSFVILRYLSGFFISGPSAVIYAYLGEFHSNRHRAVVMSLSASFIAVGMMIVPALGWLILPMTWQYSTYGFVYRPWRLLMAMCGLPSLLLGISLLNVPESPKFLLAKGKIDELFIVLKQIYKWNTGQSEMSFPIKSIKLDDMEKKNQKKSKQSNILRKVCKQTFVLFKPPYLLKTLMISVIQFGIFAASSGHFLWFPQVLNEVINANRNSQNYGDFHVCKYMVEKNITTTESIIDSEVAVTTFNRTAILTTEMFQEICNDSVDMNVFKITIVLGAIFTGFYLVIGTVVNFIGARYLVVLLLASTGIAGLTIPFWQNYAQLIIFYGIFLLAGTSVGVTNTIVVDLYPTKVRAMAMAISLMIGRLGAVIGSQIIGHLLFTYCSMAFYSFSITLIGWLNTLPLAISLAIAPFIRSFAVRKKSTRLCAICSGLLIALSYLFASFANQFHQIAISFGLIFALGHGISNVSAQIMLSQFFKKKRFYIEALWMLTNGFTLIIQPLFVHFLLQRFGWRLSMQILAVSSATIFLFSIFYRPASLYHPQRRAILHLRNQKWKIFEKNSHEKTTTKKLASFTASISSKKKEQKLHFYYPKNVSIRILFLTTITTSYAIYLPLLSFGNEFKESQQIFVIYGVVGAAYSIGVSIVALTIFLFGRFYRQRYFNRYLKLQICELLLILLAVVVFLYPFLSSMVKESTKKDELKKFYIFGSFMAFYGFCFGSFEFVFKMYIYDKSKSNRFLEMWSFLQLTKSFSIFFGHPIKEFISTKYNQKIAYLLNASSVILGLVIMCQINRRLQKQQHLQNQHFEKRENLKDIETPKTEDQTDDARQVPRLTGILISDSFTDSDECNLDGKTNNLFPMEVVRSTDPTISTSNDIATVVTPSDSFDFITSCCDHDDNFLCLNTFGSSNLFPIL